MSRQEKLAALASTGVTKAELDNIDGGTARGTTAIADGDGVLINDAGTMRMTSVETLATYIGTKVGGGTTFIASSGAISGAASVTFSQSAGHFDSSKYDSYIFYILNVVPVTDGADFRARTSTNNGSSYATSSGDYVTYGTGNTDKISAGLGIGSAADEYGVSGFINLLNPHQAKYTHFISNSISVQNTSGTHTDQGQAVNFSSGFRKEAADIDAIQFTMSSGNIESGEVTMFGIANS